MAAENGGQYSQKDLHTLCSRLIVSQRGPLDYNLPSIVFLDDFLPTKVSSKGGHGMLVQRGVRGGKSITNIVDASNTHERTDARTHSSYLIPGSCYFLRAPMPALAMQQSCFLPQILLSSLHLLYVGAALAMYSARSAPCRANSQYSPLPRSLLAQPLGNTADTKY